MPETTLTKTPTLNLSIEEVSKELETRLKTLNQTATAYGVSRDNLEGQYLNAHMAAMEAHCKLVLASGQDMKNCVHNLEERSNTELQKIRESGNQYHNNLSSMLDILKEIKKVSVEGIEKQHQTAILNAIKAIMPTLEEPLQEQCQMLLDKQAIHILQKKAIFFGTVIFLFLFIGYGLRGCADGNTRQIDLAVTACELKPLILPDGKKVCDLNTLSIYKGH